MRNGFVQHFTNKPWLMDLSSIRPARNEEANWSAKLLRRNGKRLPNRGQSIRRTVSHRAAF